MKRTTILSAVLLTCLVFMSCEDDKDEFSGILEVTVIFDDAEKGSDDMIMAFLWKGSSFTSAKDAGTVDSYMFSFGTDTVITQTASFQFEDLSEGSYYCGIFESHDMMYDDHASSMGFYCVDSTNTTGSANPTAITLDLDNEHQTISLTITHHGDHQ